MKRALILGFQKSGRSSYKYLKQKHYQIDIYDDKIKSFNYNFISKEKILNELPQYDIIVRSPGFPSTHPLYPLFLMLGKRIVSEIELAYHCLKRKHVRFIGVTGSNGKTTVVTLLANLFLAINQKVHVLGNISEPLLKEVDNIHRGDTVILELSSFQLENIYDFKPDLVIFTNFTYNHLNMVNSYQYYIASKKRLLLNIKNEPVIYANQDYLPIKENYLNIFHNDLMFLKDDKLIYQGQVIISKEELTLPYKYYLIDASLALLAMIVLEGFHLEFLNCIKEFKGVKYRQEVIKCQEGIFVNDAKSTSVDSLQLCMSEFQSSNRAIILGGIYKSLNIEKIKFLASDEIYLFGEDKYKLLRLIKKGITYDNLHEVLKEIQNKKYDVVIFSPSCSSFDQYQSYIERGEEFERFVKEHYHVLK